MERAIPWSHDKRKPKHHDDKFTIEKHLHVTASSLGFPSRNQTPSSSFSTKANGASAHTTFLPHSMVLASPCVVSSSISISGLPKSISLSLAPTMSYKWTSFSAPPKVTHPKPTEKTKFCAITRVPSSHEMQGTKSKLLL